ncbi:MAG: hypothetical protein HQK98_03515 [Nitrospirae bacterium]|nr:hypothetical protein [Nitrospirota bacterium]
MYPNNVIPIEKPEITAKRKKTGGRPKGVRNKRRNEVAERFALNEVDPIEMLIYAAKISKTMVQAAIRTDKVELVYLEPALDRLIRVSSEMAQYAYPRLKAVDIENNLNITARIERVEEVIHRIKQDKGFDVMALEG